MKKFLFAMVACVALAGCKEEGQGFIGVWKGEGETITVTKSDEGYRAISELDNKDFPFAKVEVKLHAESDSVLIASSKQTKALELAGDGKITSHLRSSAKTFSKAN